MCLEGHCQRQNWQGTPGVLKGSLGGCCQSCDFGTSISIATFMGSVESDVLLHSMLDICPMPEPREHLPGLGSGHQLLVRQLHLQGKALNSSTPPWCHGSYAQELAHTNATMYVHAKDMSSSMCNTSHTAGKDVCHCETHGATCCAKSYMMLTRHEPGFISKAMQTTVCQGRTGEGCVLAALVGLLVSFKCIAACLRLHGCMCYQSTVAFTILAKSVLGNNYWSAAQWLLSCE